MHGILRYLLYCLFYLQNNDTFGKLWKGTKLQGTIGGGKQKFVNICNHKGGIKRERERDRHRQT